MESITTSSFLDVRLSYITPPHDQPAALYPIFLNPRPHSVTLLLQPSPPPPSTLSSSSSSIPSFIKQTTHSSCPRNAYTKGCLSSFSPSSLSSQGQVVHSESFCCKAIVIYLLCLYSCDRMRSWDWHVSYVIATHEGHEYGARQGGRYLY